MSKHRPPQPTPASTKTSTITPDSSLVTLLRAKIEVRQEMLRRLAYQELQDLEAELARMPPIPSPEPAPANED